MRAKSRTRNRPTDGWTIGVEFDESSLLNRERDSSRGEGGPARGVTRVRKMTGPEEEILYRWNSSVNPYPSFSSDPFYPRGLGHRAGERGCRKRKRKVASDLGEDVTREE